jgi:phosphate uptake regulator
VASLVEAIGDECVRVASKTVELKGSKLDEDLKKSLADFHSACFEAHENAFKAFLVGDMGLAENVRLVREKIEKMFANIEKIAKAQPIDVVAHILAAASALRQIYEHSVDMADLTMPKNQ